MKRKQDESNESEEKNEPEKKQRTDLKKFKTIISDGEALVDYCAVFLDSKFSSKLKKELLAAPLTEDVFNRFGKIVKSPRLMCAFGYEELTYHYAGTSRKSVVWSPELLILRDLIQPYCTHNINYALVNVYKDGKDHLGFHSDE